MKTVKLSSSKWREVAMEYKPKKNFDRVMRDIYGLERVILESDLFGQNYQIVDESKYTFFILRWG